MRLIGETCGAQIAYKYRLMSCTEGSIERPSQLKPERIILT